MEILANLRRRFRRGTAVVEAAIIFPLLLMLTLGLIHYGFLLLKVHQITNAARQACRIGCVPDATDQDIIDTVATIMLAADMPAYALDVNTAVPLPPLEAGQDPRTGLTVRIVVDTNDIPLIAGGLVPTPASVHGTVTMAKEGAL